MPPSAKHTITTFATATQIEWNPVHHAGETRGRHQCHSNSSYTLRKQVAASAAPLPSCLFPSALTLVASAAPRFVRALLIDADCQNDFAVHGTVWMTITT